MPKNIEKQTSTPVLLQSDQGTSSGNEYVMNITEGVADHTKVSTTLGNAKKDIPKFYQK